MKPAKRRIASTALHTVQREFPNVNTVRDADESLTVEVTSDINKLATVKNHTNCAMAVACKRKMHADGVIIGMRSCYIVKGDEAIRFAAPERVRREITSFDRGAGFAPGIYKLNPPDAGRRLGTHYTGATHNPSARHRPHMQAFPTDALRTNLSIGGIAKPRKRQRAA